MTFSIAVFEKLTGAAGVATATGMVSVGGFVPHVRAGVGAITTQGTYTNWVYGERGLNLLTQQMGAQETLNHLTSEDDGREFRQCLIIDSSGQTAEWTGAENFEQKEVVSMPGLIAGGNLLAASGVADAMISAFLANKNDPLPWKLYSALRAGEDNGGDSRGLISAAIKIDYPSKPPVDLRVDYAPGEVCEQLRILCTNFYRSPFAEFYNSVPTRSNYSKHGSNS